MFKLLIHEANHAFRQRKAMQNGTLNFPTKAEEMECETLALTSTAKMVQSGLLDDYEIYNQSISSFKTSSDVSNSNEVKNWLDGYSKLADNLNGDITIQHSSQAYNDNLPKDVIQLGDDDGVCINGTNYKIEQDGKLVEGNVSGQKINISNDSQIKYRGRVYNISVLNKTATTPQVRIESGDKLTINGLPSMTIGEDLMLEGVENTCITQMIIHHKDFSTPTLLGRMIFDDVQPTQSEYDMAKLDNNNGVKAVPFTITKKDGSQIKGVCYPEMDELNKLNK